MAAHRKYELQTTCIMAAKCRFDERNKVASSHSVQTTNKDLPNVDQKVIRKPRENQAVIILKRCM